MTDQYVEAARPERDTSENHCMPCKLRRGNGVNGKRMMMVAASDYDSFVLTRGDVVMAHALK